MRISQIDKGIFFITIENRIHFKLKQKIEFIIEFIIEEIIGTILSDQMYDEYFQSNLSNHSHTNHEHINTLFFDF